ncbi:unnamed protein product [Ectocarpus sp. CCAP 1310/34]|nr:unnamed protein product [Ectocarpus sp. CCAP 1310/34]
MRMGHGFAEIDRYKDTVKDLRLHPLVLLLLVQINQAAGEDLFRYVVRSLAAFEQTVLEKACEKSATRRHRSSDGPPEEDRGSASPHCNAARKAEDVSDATMTGFKDGLIDLEHLKEAVDRNLVFKRAANGDAGGALERLGCCVEVFERYPCVYRFMLQWCHLAHAALAALAAIDDSRARELYNRLREAYNPSLPTASLPVPPKEEWQGLVTFCHDFQCRCVGARESQQKAELTGPLGQLSHKCSVGWPVSACGSSIRTRPCWISADSSIILCKLFEGIVARKPDCTSNCEGLQQTLCKDEDLRFVGEEHHGSVSAGVISEDVVSSITISPCSNADTPMASTASSWELNAESAPQMNPGSSSSASHAHRESGRGGLGNTGVFDGAVEGCGGGVLSGLVAQVPDMALTSPGLRMVDGTTRETRHKTIAEADWQDVACVLDALDEKSPVL